MNFTSIAQSRYSTKAFDPSKAIPAEDFQQLRDLLRLSPSSVNVQPWHFVVAETAAGRARLAKGTEGFYSFNRDKVLNASHVILFCARTDLSEEYLELLLDSEEKAGRFATPDAKAGTRQVRKTFIDIHRYDLKDLQHWMEKQLYLNMGTILLGAGGLGIDAVPIEGIDCKALNSELGLLEQGYCAVAMVALGYRAAEDFNAALPKARLDAEHLITTLD